VDPETGETRIFFAAVGDVRLLEPGGLCQLEDGRVVVADTNHNRLVRISKDGRDAEVLVLRNEPTGTSHPGQAPAPEEGVRTLRTVALGPGDVTLRLHLETPEGLDLTEGSRVSIQVTSGTRYLPPAGDQGFEARGSRKGVPVLLRMGKGGDEGSDRGVLEVRVEVTLCGHGDRAACWPVHSSYRIPFRIAPSAPDAAEARLPLPDPRGSE
jgi:hypothetical protein